MNERTIPESVTSAEMPSAASGGEPRSAAEVTPHTRSTGAVRPWSTLAQDVPAAVVVFLVAAPLCLGIALASGAPLIAGLVTGMVGGMVVAWASGSQLSVSGPAAGLSAIVLGGIGSLGYEGFLLAVVLAGLMQVALGFLKAGIVAWYFPSSVIHGMLAGIGWLIILKQVPHAIGLDTDAMGEMSFWGTDARNTFSEIAYAVTHLRWGAAAVGFLGLVVLFGWDAIPQDKRPRWLPGPLLAVIASGLVNAGFIAFAPSLAIEVEHLVGLPTGGPAVFFGQLSFPDFTRILDGRVWLVAATIAIVGSIETLLCLEAVDKLDPEKRVSPPNRELNAQGLGNVIAGLLGGIPMTAVIVRGSANVQAGGRTRVSAFLHGVFLLLAVLAVPHILNLIPLAALAAVLIHVGYKLTKPSLVRRMYSLGRDQFVPFVATIAGILLLDLLKGVAIGLGLSIFFLLKRTLESPYVVSRRESHLENGCEHVRIELAEHVSFFHKASVIRLLHEIAPRSVVEIVGTRSVSIDRDVLEILHDFHTEAEARDMHVEFIDIPSLASSGAISSGKSAANAPSGATPAGSAS